jgi:hypothetical protein
LYSVWLARHEGDHGRDRAPARELDAVVLARDVAQPPRAHQGGGAAAVEVERRVRAEGDEGLGQLRQREAGLVVGAPVARDGQQPPARREPDRGPRVAPGRDVGVELAVPRREALDVAGHARHAVAHQQRAGLQEVSGRLGGQRVALGERHVAAHDVQAGPDVGPGRVERARRPRDAARAQLAERRADGAHEEAAHDRLGDGVLAAPALERLRRGQADDARDRSSQVVRGHVQRRGGAVVEHDTVALEVAWAYAEGAGGGAGERALKASGHGVVAQGVRWAGRWS